MSNNTRGGGGGCFPTSFLDNAITNLMFRLTNWGAWNEHQLALQRTANIEELDSVVEQQEHLLGAAQREFEALTAEIRGTGKREAKLALLRKRKLVEAKMKNISTQVSIVGSAREEIRQKDQTAQMRSALKTSATILRASGTAKEITELETTLSDLNDVMEDTAELNATLGDAKLGPARFEFDDDDLLAEFDAEVSADLVESEAEKKNAVLSNGKEVGKQSQDIRQWTPVVPRTWTGRLPALPLPPMGTGPWLASGGGNGDASASKGMRASDQAIPKSSAANSARDDDDDNNPSSAPFVPMTLQVERVVRRANDADRRLETKGEAATATAMAT